MGNKFDRYLYRFWQILLLAALTTPIYFYKYFFFPFIYTKALFFRSIIELALLVGVVLYFRGVISLPKRSKVLWAVLTYLGVMTFVSLVGVNFYHSFWSNTERSEGLLWLYHLGALFVMMPLAFRTSRGWRWVAYVTGAVSLYVSIYALLQEFGSSWVIASSGGARLTATIGNAAFLGAYLIFHTFLFLWGALRFKNVWAKIGCGIAALFEIFILYQTETRGAVIGLGVGFLVLLALLIWRTKRSKVRATLGGALLLIILVPILIFAAKNSSFVQSQTTLKRLTSISSSDTTSRNRLVTWKASWQAFKDRPIFGYGYENYNVGFNKHFPAVIYEDTGSQIWFDRAHNIIFDQMVAGGILGLLAFLSIIAAAVNVIYRLFKRGDYLMGSFLVSLLIAYLLQDLFVFDTPSTYVVWLALLAYLHHLATVDEPMKVRKHDNVSFYAGSVLAAVVLIVVFYFANAQAYGANKRLALAAGYEKGAELANLPADQAQAGMKAAATSYNQAADTPTYLRFEARQKFAEFMLNATNMTDDDFKNYLTKAIADLKQSIKEDPKNVFNYIQLMGLLNRDYNYDKTALQQAIDLAPQALKLSPTRPQIYFELGQAELSLGHGPEAIQAFKDALAVNPKPYDSQWNLVLAYAFTGDVNAANQKLSEMLASGFQINASYYTYLGKAFLQNKNYAAAEGAYAKAAELEPSNVTNWANLAIVQSFEGKLNEAIATAEKIKQIEPSLSDQVDQFITQLRTGKQ